MVLPAWSGQVTPADAARAPRLDMIPGETLMAGYAYNDSLSRHPNTLQRTVDQLQGLIVPETKTLGAQSLADKHFYRRKGLKHAAETLVAYQSVKAVGSQHETIQRTELVRKLVPQLGHDFMQIQKRDKAHADFQKLGRVREALDDLRTQLRAYDENSHIRSTLEKQEQMKKNSIFEMATLKRQWKFDMEQLEATYDQKDMAVINKYHNKLRLLQSELAGNTAPLGFEKTPKLNTRGLELKGRLDAFASLKAENAAAYAQAIVLQDDLVIFEEAAEKDFEAGQAAERRRKTQAVMKERDAELLKLNKRRVGARTKLEHSLRLRAELMAQRQKNYQKAVNHDFVVGMDSRVMQGVVPKRPLPLIPRHPEMVATADRLQRRPHTVVSSGKSKLPMLPSPFGATRPGTVQSGGSGNLPSRGTSRGTNSQHTPFNPRLLVS